MIDTNLRTIFFLMAQYNGKTIISIAEICRDYFTHLTPEKFIRKVTSGQIKIPLVQIEASKKAAKGIYLIDLANYLDERRQSALKEFENGNV